MNYDYLSAEEFDYMTEEEFLNWLDEKARRIREENHIRPLDNYNTKLAKMVSTLANEKK